MGSRMTRFGDVTAPKVGPQRSKEHFFINRARPDSVATEFVDTDWDDDDILSDIEDIRPADIASLESPRLSIDSGNENLLESSDEIQTPRSSDRNNAFIDLAFDNRPVEGPRGPHLFRSASNASSQQDVPILSLSPLTPKRPEAPSLWESANFSYPPLPQLPLQASSQTQSQSSSQYQIRAESLQVSQLPQQQRKYSQDVLDPTFLIDWTPSMVTQWMIENGLAQDLAEKFLQNDINGLVLISLQYEDLKELQITSFGLRTQTWVKVQQLRDSQFSQPRVASTMSHDSLASPVLGPSSSFSRRSLHHNAVHNAHASGQNDAENYYAPRRRGRQSDDVISPMESVSIVGIEQVIPKPHYCSKGERCAKFRKQQRLIEAFCREHPDIDIDNHGIVITGDPGNPFTAARIDPYDVNRPVSETQPSTVASSDVLGPGTYPTIVQALQSRDQPHRTQAQQAQDNVRQFLRFQATQDDTTVPPTPPFLLTTTNPKVKGPSSPLSPQSAQSDGRSPMEKLQSLPKLSIPGVSGNNHLGIAVNSPDCVTAIPSAQGVIRSPGASHNLAHTPFTPYRMDRADPISRDLQSPVCRTPIRSPVNPYRFGTPFSEMDVPLTVSSPVSYRDMSSSVPPDMTYRFGNHTPGPTPPSAPSPSPTPSAMSRMGRKQSISVLPPLNENQVASPTNQSTSSSERKGSMDSATLSPAPSDSTTASSISANMSAGGSRCRKVLRAPPRHQYPWSSAEGSQALEISVIPPTVAKALPISQALRKDSSIAHEGHMKQRKTKFLRHEWQDTYVTLSGTRMAMHKNEMEITRPKEFVDVDDYSITCSNVGSQSKLTAAFKTANIRNGSGFGGGAGPSKKDSSSANVGAFAFQLIPQNKQSITKMLKQNIRKIDSDMPANGNGKTYHFAVKSRDDRIDWMRELMLAKALKQRSELEKANMI